MNDTGHASQMTGRSADYGSGRLHRSRLIMLLILFFLSVLILVLVSHRSSLAQDKGDLVIGFNADQTSDGTGLAGISARQGFEIAISEANARGGVLGRKVRGVVYDDRLDKELSKQNVLKLIHEDHALAIIGPANSGNALHWLEVAQESGTTVVSPIATASQITQQYKDRPRNYIFRVAPTDMNEIRVVVPYALRVIRKGKVAVFYDSTGYGIGGNRDTLDVLSRWGVVPLLDLSFDRGASSSTLRQLLLDAQAHDVECLIIYALADSTSDVLKELSLINDYHPLIVGPYANVIPSLWNLSGKRAESVIFGTAVAVDADHSLLTRRLNEKIIAHYGTATPSSTFAAQGYDATKLVLRAIERAGSDNKTAIRDALENTDLLPGAVKLYRNPFSKDNHEALSVHDIILARWSNGVVIKINDRIFNSIEIR